MATYLVHLRKCDGTEHTVATNSPSLARRTIERARENGHLVSYSSRAAVFEKELWKDTTPGLGTTRILQEA